MKCVEAVVVMDHVLVVARQPVMVVMANSVTMEQVVMEHVVMEHEVMEHVAMEHVVMDHVVAHKLE